MSVNDIVFLSSQGDDSASVPVTYNVLAAATTINIGEPVARALGAANVTAAATGTPVVGTDFFVGIAASKSTQTASAAGVVTVTPFRDGDVLLANPTTVVNWDTAAEYLARTGRRVTLALASGAYTINDTDGATNGLVVQYLDTTNPAFKNTTTGAQKVAFSVRAAVSSLA